jgi:hypothetical protein
VPKARCTAGLMSADGVVRPCSGPAGKRSWREAPKTRSTLIGIDIGKNSFHGHDKRVAIMLRQNWSRGRARLANLPPCLIS